MLKMIVQNKSIVQRRTLHNYVSTSGLKYPTFVQSDT